jgi:acyl carrier protein
MEIELFVKVLTEEVFCDCSEIISIESHFKELDCWDSVTSLTLIAIFDTEFSVRLSGEDIRSANSLNDLYKLVIDNSNA